MISPGGPQHDQGALLLEAVTAEGHLQLARRLLQAAGLHRRQAAVSGRHVIRGDWRGLTPCPGAGGRVVDWFYDAGMSGDAPVSDGPGFTAMLDRSVSNGVRTVIVESADRFARKMLTAELGILLLVSRGVTLLTAAGANLTDTDGETRVAFRQKARRQTEGQKGHARGDPEPVRLAVSIWREGRTLPQTSAALGERGYLTAKHKPLSASQIKCLVEAE